MANKLPVGILGATGAVGQRFVQQLVDHPWFEICALGASERSAGRTYESAVKWLLNTPIPELVKQQKVWPCDPHTPDSPFTTCKLVFSALDSSVAGPLELSFAKHGIAGKQILLVDGTKLFTVFSNSKNHRYEPDVPIIIPYVNASHFDIIKYQQQQRDFGNGFIITNPNCSTTGLVVALKPIEDMFGIEEAVVFTMQAISGAGYPGVASMDILDNVVPFIDGEEDKIEKETRKILGKVETIGSGVEMTQHFTPLPLLISAHTNRVCVLDGHTICVSLRLKKKATPDEVINVLQNFTSDAQRLNLPSAPKSPITVLYERDRPQPRLDRETAHGYTVSVGRVRSGHETGDSVGSSFDILLDLFRNQ